MLESAIAQRLTRLILHCPYTFMDTRQLPLHHRSSSSSATHGGDTIPPTGQYCDQRLVTNHLGVQRQTLNNWFHLRNPNNTTVGNPKHGQFNTPPCWVFTNRSFTLPVGSRFRASTHPHRYKYGYDARITAWPDSSSKYQMAFCHQDTTQSSVRLPRAARV
jgi:hypothetical protein